MDGTTSKKSNPKEIEARAPSNPRRVQILFFLKQLPALLRHIPTFLTDRSVKHVNPKRHYVWLFDNYAFRKSSLSDGSLDSDNAIARMMDKEDDPWQTEYTTAFFKRDSGKALTDGVALLCKELDVEDGTPSQSRLRYRLQHFVDPVLARHTIHSSAGKGLRHLHGPSSSSGISTTNATLPSFVARGDRVVNTFPGTKPCQGFLPGVTTFAEPGGWGIISDIDDTIKITLTPSPLGILSTTFLEEATPVPGMPELYRDLNTLLHSPTFFYVSASPYNLYPMLRAFRTAHYPQGQIMLRETTWQNLGGLIGGLMEDVKDYKLAQIERVHAYFPKRRFVLVGDTTHKDPETYAEVARRYPGWVLGIFIRRVTGVNDVAAPHLEEKNSDERLLSAFEGVDPDLWCVFEEPRIVGEVVRRKLAESGKKRTDSVTEL
ncbi:hypothetical protein ANO11243_055180 [Dothideomycetidae sp. 11243]|nr:hypothetical protein ANO11243_055180 [fungal sp. No.11243]